MTYQPLDKQRMDEVLTAHWSITVPQMMINEELRSKLRLGPFAARTRHHHDGNRLLGFRNVYEIGGLPGTQFNVNDIRGDTSRVKCSPDIWPIDCYNTLLSCLLRFCIGIRRCMVARSQHGDLPAALPMYVAIDFLFLHLRPVDVLLRSKVLANM